MVAKQSDLKLLETRLASLKLGTIDICKNVTF